jgi:hypothetical protein
MDRIVLFLALAALQPVFPFSQVRAQAPVIRVVETASAWSWSRQAEGYEELPGVRTLVETYDTGWRPLRRDHYLPGGALYSSTRFIYDAGLPPRKEVAWNDGSLLSRSEFRKVKNGSLEYMYDARGNLFRLFYRRTDSAGRIAELQTVDSRSNLLTRRKFYYDERGLLVAAVTYDGDRRPLYISSFQYDGFDQAGRWTVRQEDATYADTSAPKEKIVRAVSNASGRSALPRGAESPVYPEVSVDAFVSMTSSLSQGAGPGAKVLGRALQKILNRTIIQGSCYDWINAIYNELGYAGKNRQPVFSGKETGPYANPMLLQPGDWIMFKNQTFGDIGHSGIFLGWLDFESRSAIVIGYVGQNRVKPGQFREYDLTRLFGIVRGKD